MEDELFRLIPEEGKHLADSHNNEDAVRGVYLNDETNKPCGAGEFVKVNLDELMNDYSSETNGDGESDDATLAIAAFIGIGVAIGVAAKTAYPHVKKWVKYKAIPGVKRVWNGIFHKDEKVLVIETEEDSIQIEYNNFYDLSIDRVVDDYKGKMTSDEAKKELLDAFMLYVLSARKLRSVAQAQIVSVDGKLEDGTELIEKIISSGIIDEVNSILVANPDLLEEQHKKILSDILGYQIKRNDQYIGIDALELENGLINAS